MNPDQRQAFSAQLGFADLVRSHFAFVASYGFCEIEGDATIVRFASSDVTVDVFHAPRSFQLGVELELLSMGRSFQLGDVIRTVSPEWVGRPYLATTRSELVAGLTLFADLLLRYGEPALKGDPLFFARVAEQRNRQHEEFARNLAYRQISPKAHEAFAAQDYAKASALFERIEASLAPSELAKLAYARRHRT